ncbi:MAG: NADH-quinone oxidoreductase subunit N [Bryobacterales bacterium]
MSPVDFIAIAPLIVTAATAVVVMLAIAIHRAHALAAGLCCAGLAAAMLSIGPAWSASPRQVTALLIVDHYGLFYIALLLAGSLVVAIFAHGYQKHATHPEELYLLLLLAALGSAVLVVSSHFISLFLGLEILSVALYALIAYPRLRQEPVEAGIKYLVLGSASAGFLLFGMALVYAQLGTMTLARLASALASGIVTADPVIALGVALMLTGVGFKLGVVPFHMWAPDVYEGAPAPVGAFIATVSKASMVALLFRYFAGINISNYRSLLVALSVIAIASMFAGNLLALLQTNLKRILAYSSISHLGYVLVAIQAPGRAAAEAAAYYLAAYMITLLLAFGAIAVLSKDGKEMDRLEDYRGLFWRNPLPAAALTAAMLSLAGIPLTAGFIGKFYIVAAGVEAALWPLVIVLVITSVIGLFYYLRVVVAIYGDPPRSDSTGSSQPANSAPTGRLALSALMLALIVLGVYPGPLMNVLRSVTAELLH